MIWLYIFNALLVHANYLKYSWLYTTDYGAYGSVDMYDSDGNRIYLNDIPIYAYLKPSSTVESYGWKRYTNSGNAVFYVGIWCFGTYQVVVHSAGFEDAISDPFTTYSDFCNELTATIELIPSTDLYKITLETRSLNEGGILLDCSYKIEEINDNSFSGISSQESSSNSSQFYISFSTFGIKKLIGVCNNTVSRYFEVEVFSFTGGYISSTFISNIPSVVNSNFSILVQVYQDQDFTIKITEGNYLINVILSPHSNFTIVSGHTENGEITFNNLSTIKSGLYCIVSYSEGMHSNFSQEFYLKPLDVRFEFIGEPPHHLNQNFSISLSIWAGETFIQEGSYKLEILTDPITNWTGESQVVTNNGVYTYENVTINEIGSFYFLTYIYGYASESDLIEILPYYKIFFSDPIIYVNTIFTIKFSPYIDDLFTQPYNGKSLFLMIYLNPLDIFLCFNWPWMFRTESACDYVSISDPGEYRIQIESNNYYVMLTDPFKVNIFAIPNFITFVNNIQPKSPSEVLDFYITLSCDEDLISLYGNMEMTINVIINNENKETMLSSITQNGLASFKLDPIENLSNTIIKIEGDFIFTICIPLYIKAYLDIEIISEISRSSENQIKAKIGVFKDQQLTMKMPVNSCNILLRLEPQGDLSDWTCSTKNDDYMYVTNLYVLSSGEFNLIAYNDEIYYNASTPKFTISFISKVFVITLSIQSTEIISNQFFIVRVEIFKKNRESYTDSTMIYLNCSNFICNGETMKQNNNGKVDFNISTNIIGEANIIAYTDNDSLAQHKDILSINILDPLCSILDENNNCTECTENAQKIEGVCQCGEFSEQSSDKRKCQCQNSYLSYDYFCKACKNYIIKEDISSYYTEDYKGIIVHFLKTPIFSKVPCLFSFPYSDYSDFTCHQVDDSTFLIQFNHYIPQITTPIIYTELITSKEANCSFFDEPLEFIPDCIYPLPTPFIDFVYPYTISLVCSSSKLYFSTLITDPDYIYSWNATVDPMNIDLINYLVMQNTSEIYIEKKFLSQGSLEIELKVMSRMFNTFTVKSAIIEVTDETRIQVDFNTGDEIYIKARDNLSVRVQVSSRCGLAGPVFYSWGLISPNITEKAMIYSGSESESLKINGGFLKPGNIYVFEVKVQAGSKIASSKRLTIYCLYDELSLKLNRLNGIVGLDYDFEVTAEAEDVDDITADIKIEWSCLETSSLCKGNDGEILFSVYTGALLIIPKEKLRNGATYTLNCTASTPQKSKSLIISITINSSAAGLLEIFAPESSIITQSPITLYSILTSSVQSSIIWSSFNKFPLIFSSFENKSYLKILPEYLNPGETYQISASVNSSNLISFISISRKKLPECLGFTAKFVNKKWSLKVQNCSSENGNLLYQYGFSYQNEIIWITESLYKNSVSLFGKTDALQAVVQVCDKYSCILYYVDLPKENRKLLEEFDFYQELSLADSIPDTLIFYFKNAEESLLPTIFSSFSDYYIQGVSTKSEFLTFVTCFEALMNNYIFFTIEQIDTALNILINNLVSAGISLDNSTTHILIKVISQVINKATVKIFLDTLLKINQYSLFDMFPGDKNLFSQDILLYNLRVYNTSKIIIHEENLMIDVNANLDENFIYDFYFAKFELADLSLIVSTNLQIVGNYDNYRNTQIFDRLDEYIKSVKVSFKQEKHFGDENFKCTSYDNTFWNSSNCNVIIDKDKEIKITYKKSSDIKIKWYPVYGCEESLFIPVILMILTPLCFFAAIIFLIYDWRSQNETLNSLQVISLASLVIKQPHSKRAFTLLHILGVFCCSVFSIECFNHLFLFKIEIQSISIFPSLAAILIINLFASLFLFIKVRLFMIRLWRIIGFTLILIIILSTIAASCILSDGVCEDKQRKWISISAIVFVFHTVVLESFYGGVVQIFTKNVVNRKRKVDDFAERVVLDHHQSSEKDVCKSLEEEKTENKRE
ncbi:hypothetical protein SteCoe_11034 [Stentor coeruleus]|uniref:GPS domain-containing protein n=1 Tax=Stentor coeruleus TaxID=5963 RepID=A0A1R2CE70_9CILI|nr:hypothetical protein SteCoe_11034 [Stentor coeruleus]